MSNKNNALTDYSFYPFYQKYQIFIKAGSKIIGQIATILPLKKDNIDNILNFEKLFVQLNEQVELLESLIEIGDKKISQMKGSKVSDKNINVFKNQLEEMSSWILSKVSYLFTSKLILANDHK